MSNQNHIIIGLGGTGGKIMAEFRRQIYELEGKINLDPKEEASIGYLYVDSSDEFMDKDGGGLWEIPGGGSLYIEDGRTLNIHGNSLRNTLDNISAYPSIQPWIGSKGSWSHIQAAVDAGIGGQKRRLGRFIFACKAKDFALKLDEQVKEREEQTGHSFHVFHIVTGLAGGTGSGSLIDVIAQIRKKYNTFEQHRIIVYALLPEEIAPFGWAQSTDSAYYANGYAALMELNALSIGKYEPYDLNGTGGRVKLNNGAFQSKSEAPPFDGCYVLSNENENNRVENVEKREIHKVIAGFLYQKIVAVQNDEFQNELQRHEVMENMEEDPSEGRPEIERSMRFATFGIKRLVIPERDIKEYLALSSAKQAILQSLYNNPSDSGYLEGKSPDLPPFLESHKLKEEQKRCEKLRYEWKMSEGHLLQDSTDAKIETFKASFDSGRILAKILQNPQERWMDLLGAEYGKLFKETFRGQGAEEYFRQRAREITSEVREIIRTIAADLYHRWRNGEWGLVTCQEVLRKEIDWLEAFRKENAENRGRYQDILGAMKKTRSDLDKMIDLNLKEWSKVGPLSALYGKSRALIDAQASLYREKYHLMLMVLATAHAENLIIVLDRQLRELDDQLLDGLIRQHSEVLNSRVGENGRKSIEVHLSDLCRDEDAYNGDFSGALIKYYEPAKVREFAVKMFSDKEICRHFADRYRNHMGGILDQFIEGEQLFRFGGENRKQEIYNCLIGSEVESEIRNKHEDFKNQTHEKPVLGENIIDKLSRGAFGNPADRKELCKEMVSKAGTYLKWNGGQIAMEGQGIGLKSNKIKKHVAVILPKAPNNEAYRGDLKGNFQEVGSDSPKPKVYESNNSKSQEIVVISLKSFFPLRYTSTVGVLREKYDKFISSKGGEDGKSRAMMELHTETRDYPPLYPLDASERDEYFREYLTAAKIMGLTKEAVDESNRPTSVFMSGNGPIDLRGSCDAALHELTTEQLYTIKNDVSEKIENARKSASEKLAAWLSDCDALIVKLDEQYSNPLDPIRLREEKALRNTMRLLS